MCNFTMWHVALKTVDFLKYNITKRVDFFMVKNLMYRLGMRISNSGCAYLKFALDLVASDASLLGAVTRVLYPAIAAHFCVSPSSVEYAIRYCLDQCWEKGNRALLDEIAGRPLQYRPYTREFIIMLLRYIHRDIHRTSPAARA